VLGLSWNSRHTNVLASCGADSSIKIWDLNTQSCLHTFTHHKDKVSVVKWHPLEATVLLAGSFDHTVSLVDGRQPGAVRVWEFDGDVECVEWNFHQPQLFMIGTEKGEVKCINALDASNKPVFTLDGHRKEITGLCYNRIVPNCIATTSLDKNVKLWDISNNKPTLLYAKATNSKIFNAVFCVDSPYLLCVGCEDKKPEVLRLQQYIKFK